MLLPLAPDEQSKRVTDLTPVCTAHHHTLSTKPQEISELFSMQLDALASLSISDPATDEVQRLVHRCQRLIRSILVVVDHLSVSCLYALASQVRRYYIVVLVEYREEQIKYRRMRCIKIDWSAVVPLCWPIDRRVRLSVEFFSQREDQVVYWRLEFRRP